MRRDLDRKVRNLLPDYWPNIRKSPSLLWGNCQLVAIAFGTLQGGERGNVVGAGKIRIRWRLLVSALAQTVPKVSTSAVVTPKRKSGDAPIISPPVFTIRVENSIGGSNCPST